MRTLAITALTAFLLAGCSASNGPGGQSAEGAGHLVYNGASAGVHQTKVDCDGSGTIRWSSNLGSGKAIVTVLDGAGASKFSKTYSTTGQMSDSKAVNGASGSWTLKVERQAAGMYGAASWSGQYDAHLDC